MSGVFCCTTKKTHFKVVVACSESKYLHLERAGEELAAALRHVQPIPEVLLAQLR
jgi:hypothetical protein